MQVQCIITQGGVTDLGSIPSQGGFFLGYGKVGHKFPYTNSPAHSTQHSKNKSQFESDETSFLQTEHSISHEHS